MDLVPVIWRHKSIDWEYENNMMNQQDNQILYLECASGISGDMTVAALLDLGANEKKLRDALQSLPLDGYQIQISRVKKSGLDACDFAVILDAAHENHDHDMAYLHDHHQDGHSLQRNLHVLGPENRNGALQGEAHVTAEVACSISQLVNCTELAVAVGIELNGFCHYFFLLSSVAVVDHFNMPIITYERNVTKGQK